MFEGLRATYAIWRDNYPPGNELELIQFAYYEGCRDSILDDAAPLATLQTLALGEWQVRHGQRVRVPCDERDFSWCMMFSAGTWDYAVEHEMLDKPITRASLLRGDWNREAYDEPQTPGELAVDSLWYIPLYIAWQRVKQPGEPIPTGSSEDFRAALLRRRVRLPWG